jgi:hypothetical protein
MSIERLSLAELNTGPVGSTTAPSESELRNMGTLGLGMGRAARASLMNQIAMSLGAPPGGFHGQARLFERGDLRLVGLLALMSRPEAALNVARNLRRARQYTDANLMLTFVTAGRERASAVTAVGDKLIDSWHEGGIDFLWKTKDQLGLPRSLTAAWGPVPRFKSPETHHLVYPAYIPARDQTLVYAAQLNSSYLRLMSGPLRDEFGMDAANVAARAPRVARLVWQAYAFLAPGGRRYDSSTPLAAQLGRGFGARSALGYVAATAPRPEVALELVFKDPALNQTEWVRSAKTRVAETLFLERLLTTVRELKLPGELS